MAVCRAVRIWALTHPHEYALIHGSPVPGYVAPQDTAAPAACDGIVMAGILRDANEAGELSPLTGLPPAPSTFAGPRSAGMVVAQAGDALVATLLMRWSLVP
jgi:hypothetical protein